MYGYICIHIYVFEIRSEVPPLDINGPVSGLYEISRFVGEFLFIHVDTKSQVD